MALEARPLSLGHHRKSSTMCQDHTSLDQRSGTQTQTMKRKRSADSGVVRYSKRQPNGIAAVVSGSCPLIGILRQYGLLETVVSNLFADDLLALALTSKALHEAIIPRPSSLENLLGKLSCSSKGIEIRNRCHKKSSFFYSHDCTEYVQCGSESTNRKVETKPCVTCKVSTCDECRVHVVYQSIHETSSDPSDPAELPNFSGFVLLQPSEQPILSPYHMASDLEEDNELPRWGDPSLGKGGPYHDQGYLDVPLQMDAAAPPECINHVLDLDLGQQSLLSISEDSRYLSPSPVLMSLCDVVDQRKILLCDTCFESDTPNGPEAMPPLHKPMPPLPWLSRPAGTAPIKACHCTLRARFLDRWLCLRCYQTEESTISACTSTFPKEQTGLCRCNAIASHVLCLWCWGEVTEHGNDVVETETNGTGSSP